MQFGRKLDARRTGADDRNVQLAGPDGTRLRVGAHAGVEQAPIEFLGLLGRVEHDRMLLDAGRAEVARDAADGNDERVVAEPAIRRDFAAILVVCRSEVNALVGAVDADHLAIAILEAVPVPLRLIGQLMAPGVHASGGDFVQQRLPDMRACPIDERDLGLAFSAELIAELRCKLEPAGAAADNDDAVELRLSCRSGFGCSEIHVGLMRAKSRRRIRNVIRRR